VAVVAVVVVFLTFLAAGKSPPQVEVTHVTVTDTAGYVAGASLTNTTFTGSAGGTLVVEAFLTNANPGNNSECIRSASVTPTTFSILAIDPPNLCIAPLNESGTGGTGVYFALGLPNSGFTGTVTITIQDFQYNPPP
jgi:hypothetical protein